MPCNPAVLRFGRGRDGISWDPPWRSRRTGLGQSNSFTCSQLTSGCTETRSHSSASMRLEGGRTLLPLSEEPGRGGTLRRWTSLRPELLILATPGFSVALSGETGPAPFFTVSAMQLRSFRKSPPWLGSSLGARGGPGLPFSRLTSIVLHTGVGGSTPPRRVRPQRPQGRRPAIHRDASAVAAGPSARSQEATQ